MIIQREGRREGEQGYHADIQLSLPPRFSRDRPRFTDNLDVIKFLCKDLWTILFKKQIDNLKTNHRVCISPDGNSSTFLFAPAFSRFSALWQTLKHRKANARVLNTSRVSMS